MKKNQIPSKQETSDWVTEKHILREKFFYSLKSYTKNALRKLGNSLFVVSLLSLFWFLLRTGERPTRIVYPCQKAAVTQFTAYFIYIFPFFNIGRVVHFLKYKFNWKTLTKILFLVLVLFLLAGFASFLFDRATNYSNMKKWDSHKIHGPLGVSAAGVAAIAGADEVEAQNYEHKVVSVHDSDATNWDGNGYHWEYIDQNVVYAMFDEGMMTLTGTSNTVDAWNAVIPYQPGDDIAIKFNFNNHWGCGYSNAIDGYAETANAIIDGLVSIGVPEDNIWFYDAMERAVPNSFIDGIDYPGVRFYGSPNRGTCHGNYFHTNFVSPSSSEVSGFTCTKGNLPQDVIRPAQVLVDAEHLINVPQFKSHGNYITLALKNHYGSVTYNLNDRSSMHKYFNQGGNSMDCPLETQNILADINNNPNIRDKTRLIIGEGIFGNPHTNYQSTAKWDIFGNDDSNIYFFSVDPVAISSVMTDYLVEERGAQHHEMLHAGANLGLGVHDHWDSYENMHYSGFEYVMIDLDVQVAICSELGGVGCSSGQSCDGGNFQHSSDFGNLCCVGGACTDSISCVDDDGDGFDGETLDCHLGTDCDDSDASVNPESAEICGNDVDENCDDVAEVCDTIDPDKNGDGCVDIGEIVAYVDLWKNGLVTIQQVVSGVEQWQQGCP